MTDGEQDAAIARLVRQRGEARRQKALLENELRTAGRSLWDIGSALKSVNGSGSFNETPDFIIPQVDKAPELCGLDRIRTMLEQLRDVEKTIAQLNRAAKDLGID